MSDLQTLHIHTLPETHEGLAAFVRQPIFSRSEIVQAECKAMLARVTHRLDGMRLQGRRRGVGTGAAIGTVASVPGTLASAFIGWGARATHAVNAKALKWLFAVFLAPMAAHMIRHLAG